MMKRLYDKFHNIKRDNRGSAIVVVILAIAFVGMLVAMVVYMSYINFIMKGTDRNAKDNFYSAETALDEINVGLQNDITEAMTYAYNETMKDASKYSSYTSAEQEEHMKSEFMTTFESKFSTVVTAVPGAVPQTINNHLKSLWITTPKPGTFGAVLDSTPIVYSRVDNNSDMVPDYIVLKGIKITYTNEKGFVSIISTDINITVPNINFAANSEKPNLQFYSLIANKNLIRDSLGSTTEISGSVYGGSEDGITVEGNGTKNGVNLLFKFDSVKDKADSEFSVTAEAINVKNRGAVTASVIDSATPVAADEGRYSVYVDDINVETAQLDMDAHMYVRDDLTIDGTDIDGDGSEVKLAGEYYGYGDAASTAKASSSILINGASTSLDLSKIKQLMLAGRAYVGAVHYNANLKAESDYLEDPSILNSTSANTILDSTSSYDANENDIPLGESVALKSNQLMYLVPTDCMCYDSKTGKQLLAKNPLTYDEYRNLTSKVKYVTDSDGNETNIVSPDPAVNMVDLSKYTDLSLRNYHASYKPIFRKINGTVLVYYYLYFETETYANEFFYDYCQLNNAALRQYARTYLKEYKWSTALNNVNTENDWDTSPLSLAGNVIQVDDQGTTDRDDDTYSLLRDSYDNDMSDARYARLNNIKKSYSDTFDAMSHYLLKKKTALNSTQLSQGVYENLIDEAKISSLVTTENNYLKCKFASYKYTVEKVDPLTAAVTYDDYYAVVLDNKDNLNRSVNLSDIKAQCSNTVPTLVLATGNITIDTNMEGLVIAGNNIYINGTACTDITYNASDVINCMLATNGTTYFYEFFQNGITFANLGGVAAGSVEAAEIAKKREEDYVVLSDLIQYANWSKE